MSGGDWKDMYAAATSGDLARVRHHLRAGVDPDYQHPEVMDSALVASLVHGHDAIAQALLAHGANPNLPAEMGGLYPLEAARRAGNTPMMEALQRHGAHPPPTAPRAWWMRWLPL